MHDWWVTQSGKEPIGPVSTALLLRGIAAGKVPVESLVCEVGGTEWRPLGEVDPFAAAVLQLGSAGAEHASKDLARFDDAEEHTIADAAPVLASDPDLTRPRRRPPEERSQVDGETQSLSEPPPALQRFDGGEERTIADADPILPD